MRILQPTNIYLRLIANVLSGPPNIRFAISGFAKNPVVSIMAILSLALGIGAITAIFSLSEQTLLRNLPVAKLAGYVPARRAMQIEPLVALRYE